MSGAITRAMEAHRFCEQALQGVGYADAELVTKWFHVLANKTLPLGYHYEIRQKFGLSTGWVYWGYSEKWPQNKLVSTGNVEITRPDGQSYQLIGRYEATGTASELTEEELGRLKTIMRPSAYEGYIKFRPEWLDTTRQTERKKR